MIANLLYFIFVLGLLIFVHELGHFITAKMVGIRVERFSIGFPPRMIGKRIGDTDYCISWIPLGGYVKMAGMVDESLDAEIKGEPWEFQSKPVWQRVIVISAGSFMNILTAVVIFVAITFFQGIPEPPTTAQVGEVIPGKPAASIGLKPGDVITSVDGQSVKTWEQLTKIIHSRPDQELNIQWKRGSQIFTAEVKPELEPTAKIGLIGIAPKPVFREVGLFNSIGYGAKYAWGIIKLIGDSLWRIVTGKESIRESLGGPLKIYEITSESAKMGLESLFMFTAFLSLNLGLINLLPIPVLDGGHLVFLGIEAVRRKPLSIKTKLAIQKVGMAFLLALMVFIIFNDIRNKWF